MGNSLRCHAATGIMSGGKKAHWGHPARAGGTGSFNSEPGEGDGEGEARVKK